MDKQCGTSLQWNNILKKKKEIWYQAKKKMETMHVSK